MRPACLEAVMCPTLSLLSTDGFVHWWMRQVTVDLILPSLRFQNQQTAEDLHGNHRMFSSGLQLQQPVVVFGSLRWHKGHCSACGLCVCVVKNQWERQAQTAQSTFQLGMSWLASYEKSEGVLLLVCGTCAAERHGKNMWTISRSKDKEHNTVTCVRPLLVERRSGFFSSIGRLLHCPL